MVSIQVSAPSGVFFHLLVLSFILTHFFVFPWTHLFFVNVKMPVFSRAEFYLASLAN